MTDDALLALLDAVAAAVRTRSLESMDTLLAMLRSGAVPNAAVWAALRQFEGAYYETLAAAYSQVLGTAMGVQQIRALKVSGLALSTHLYGAQKQISAEVLGVINRHAQGMHEARKLAMDIYEGYGFKGKDGDPLKLSPANPKLPKYLREVLRDGGVRAEMGRVIARGQVTALRTPALKAGYMQALDAMENGAGGARLAKALDVAYQERMRYFANRIAQTELSRAHSDGRARDFMGEPALTVLQIRMSGTHPRVDICDMHARLDKYGLGPGCYPKELAPKPPFHPWCRCKAVPRWDLDAADAKERKKAEQAFLIESGSADSAKIMGSAAKRNAILHGADVTEVLNSGKDPMYHARMVGDDVNLPSPASLARRAPWHGDEMAGIVSGESAVKNHPLYAEAKAGGTIASARLVMDVMDSGWLASHGDEIRKSGAVLASVHAVEGVSTNKIGAMMAQWLGLRLHLPVDDNMVQINRVAHTGATGWHRLANPALFAGEVKAGADYWLLDDFIGQGGTLANLRGYITARGGRIAGMTALTGRADSAIIGLRQSTLAALRKKHGDLETWWRARFGSGFECLTESEARYLIRAEDADTIRNRLAGR